MTEGRSGDQLEGGGGNLTGLATNLTSNPGGQITGYLPANVGGNDGTQDNSGSCPAEPVLLSHLIKDQESQKTNCWNQNEQKDPVHIEHSHVKWSHNISLVSGRKKLKPSMQFLKKSVNQKYRLTSK
ncbi:uncharacterized protein MELLADRAFT_93320 [Melampsora larici-populina 98AG31]|uniref:Uncharacterized protein n=1 Tax=Melampsora larici-populina (strain 98AG31 / pathotype 3-4-7) TaxID=747676 RepID=F4S4S1_MELLP|nr:uncharacterized protein MELLADRAFT_93320 [Melampsora larici-populina 98AG31]EGG00338.1 hypothetical protein MELLADRAFT_93320 [Melampsora larici-populina 98AG31]